MFSLGNSWVFTFLLLVMAASVDGVISVQRVSPENLTDANGNFADVHSRISWAPVASGRPYTVGNISSGESALLDGLYVMAQQFVSVVMPQTRKEGVIVDINNDMKGGNFDFKKAVDKLKKVFPGFSLCVAIGMIFAVCMPFVGGCIMICRKCGQCGGKRMQRMPTKSICRCNTASLVVLTLLMGLTVVAAIFASEAATGATRRLRTTTMAGLNEFSTFMETTAKELSLVSADAFAFTSDVVTRDLNNIDVLVGNAVKSKLEAETNVDAAIQSVVDFAQNMADVTTDLLAINVSQTALREKGRTLKVKLREIREALSAIQRKKGCSDTCKAISSYRVATDIDYDKMPDIERNAKAANDVSVEKPSLAYAARKGKARFTNIPEKIRQDTLAFRRDVAMFLVGLRRTIETEVESVKHNLIEMKLAMKKNKELVKAFSTSVQQYDKTRWYATIISACVLLPIVGLQLCGVAMGVYSYNNDLKPTSRTPTSDCAGTMLKAAVVTTFVAYSLVMLLVLASFLAGAPLEKLVCRPLSDPSRSEFRMLLTEPNGLLEVHGYFLGKLLLGNASIPLTIQSALSACRSNQPVFTALMLNTTFDLESIGNYRKSIDVESLMKKMDVDLTSVTLLSNETETRLRKMKAAVQLDYRSIKAVLNKQIEKSDMLEMAAYIKVIATDGTNDDVRADLLLEANTLRDLHDGIVSDTVQHQTSLLEDIIALQIKTQPIPARIDEIIESVKTAESIVQQSGKSMVKEATEKFVKRILATVNQFSDQVLNSVKNDMGCREIWDSWESARVTLCQAFVRPLNGFWFCLGAFLFFVIPAIAFNLNLSKYFCRMQWEENVTEVPRFVIARPTEPVQEWGHRKKHRYEHYDDLPPNDLTPNDLPPNDLTPTYINPYYDSQGHRKKHRYEHYDDLPPNDLPLNDLPPTYINPYYDSQFDEFD